MRKVWEKINVGANDNYLNNNNNYNSNNNNNYNNSINTQQNKKLFG